ITRAEFAAVAVKVYEALSGTPALPAVANPFTDTADAEILKAYNIGAVNGTSATTYSPNDLLNREQAAAMLTRVFKRVTLPGWTLATDASFKLDYTKPALFADDKDISAWAKDSVYFMAANGIINGVGNNKFAPKNTTTAQQAQGYANATREQALIIAVRMVENLK
ncbi:MAG: S-layer homology domain-containing protein, partial [Oscillospiraceae bacterium]|nr:S-layer homology domain-containing protein [Oscillospiraceae bacterium]